jgi:hypothetical protein
MTPPDFAAFCARYPTQAQALEAIGLSKNMAQKYLAPGAKIPRYVALACRALANDLKPWGESV